MAVRRKLLLLAALFGCLTLATGCRTNGNQELLERELRLLEDEIYHLEDHLSHYESMLSSTRRENAALRKQLASGDSTGEPGFSGGAAPPQIDLGPPDEVMAPADEGDIEDAPPFEPAPSNPGDDEVPLDPGISLPPIDSSAADEPPQPPAAVSSRPERRDRPISYPTDEEDSLGQIEAVEIEASDDEPPVEDYMVSRVTLNRLLTGGVNQDDRPGDEGVMVVIEPRNDANQIINVPGELAVVVVDPNIQKGDPRVARWDFSADESAAHFRKSLLAEGIHLELPWPGEIPKHERLHLHVRYVPAEGTEFRADQAIDVALPPPAQHWQAAPPEAIPDGESLSTPPALSVSEPETLPSPESEPSLPTEFDQPPQPQPVGTGESLPASAAPAPLDTSSRDATSLAEPRTAGLEPVAEPKPSGRRPRPVWRPYR